MNASNMVQYIPGFIDYKQSSHSINVACIRHAASVAEFQLIKLPILLFHKDLSSECIDNAIRCYIGSLSLSMEGKLNIEVLCKSPIQLVGCFSR